jgi:hypothetical protein
MATITASSSLSDVLIAQSAGLSVSTSGWADALAKPNAGTTTTAVDWSV